MGHIVNPIAFRLYFSKFWNNNWYTNKFNYQYFFIKDLQLNEYFYSFFHLNKKNRIDFSNNMVYDSLSTFRKSNNFYITLNIFDYRLIDFSKAKRIYNIALHEYRIRKSFLKQYNRTNNRLIKQLNLKFLSYPWLYRLYINNYSKKIGNKLSFIPVKNKKIYFYRKKFFLAYTLFFFKTLSKKLEVKFLLNCKLKDLIDNILSNYIGFISNFPIKKNINAFLFSDINNYNKFMDQSKNLLEKKYVNFFSNKLKKLNKIKINNFNKKTKKYFFGVFNNILTMKNLIVKYTNLLLIINKRINYFNLKYEDNFHILNFSNLHWKRERLLALIYYLKSKSLKNKLFFQKKIINTKLDLLKIEERLKLIENKKDKKKLIKNYFVLLKNLYKFYRFIQKFNSITLIDKKFILHSYLNILNNMHLLRFNYRFAMQKQAYYKNKKNLSQWNLTNKVKSKILLNLNKYNNIFLNKLVRSIINVNFDKNFKLLDSSLQNKIKESISLKLKKNEIIKLSVNNQKINYKNFLSFMHNYKGLGKVYVKSLNLLRKGKKENYVVNKNAKQIYNFTFNKYKNKSKIWNRLVLLNKNYKRKKWYHIKSKLFFMFKRHNSRSKFLSPKKIKDFNFLLYKHKKYKNSRVYSNLIYKYTKKFNYLNKKYDKNFLFKYILSFKSQNKKFKLNNNINLLNLDNKNLNLHNFKRINFDRYINDNIQVNDVNNNLFINRKNYLYCSSKNSLINFNIREFIYIKKNTNNFNKFLILNKFNSQLNRIKPNALFLKRVIEKSEEQIKLELEKKKKQEYDLLYKKKLSLKYFSLFKNKKLLFAFNKNKLSKLYFLNSNYLKKYILKLNLAKQFNINIKRLTHADIHTWNKFSFFLYNNNKNLNFLNTNYNENLSLFYNNKLNQYQIVKRKYLYYNNQFKKIKYLIQYIKLNKLKNLNLKNKIKKHLYFKNLNQLKFLFSQIKSLRKEIFKCSLLLKKFNKFNSYLFNNNYKKIINLNLHKIIVNKKILHKNKVFKLFKNFNLIKKSKINFILNFYKFKNLKRNINNFSLLNSNKTINRINKNLNKIKNKYRINFIKFYRKFYKSKFFIKNKTNIIRNKKYFKLFFLLQFYNFKNNNINKNRNFFSFRKRKIKSNLNLNFLLKSRFNKKLYYTYYKTVTNKFSFYNTLIFKNRKIKKNKKKFYKFFNFLQRKENSKFFLENYNSKYKYSIFFYKSLYKIKKKDNFINYKIISNNFYKKMFIKKKNNNNYNYFKLKKNLLNNYKNKILWNYVKTFKNNKNKYNKNKKLILNKLLYKLKINKNSNWFFLLRNSFNLRQKKKKNLRLSFIKLLKNNNFSSMYIRKLLLNFNNNLFLKSLIIANSLNNKSKIKRNLIFVNKKEDQFINIYNKFNSLYKPLIKKDLKYNNFNNLTKNNLIVNYNYKKLNIILIYIKLLQKYKNYYLYLKNNLRQNIFLFKYKKSYWSKQLLKEKNQIINNSDLIYDTKKDDEIKKTPQNAEEYNSKLISSIYKDFLKIFNIYTYKYRDINKKKSRFISMVNYRLIGSYYYYISLFFKWHLSRNFLKNQINNIYIRFNLMLEPSAFILSRYICENLKRKLSLNKIVMSLLYDIPRTFPNIEAIQIKCTGRYSRRQRANKNWYRFGNIRTADINRIIEYASTGVVLRYGYTNIKVWFLKKKESPSLFTSFV